MHRLHYVSDWLIARHKKPQFEMLKEEDLASLLHDFYAETRNKQGKRYSHSSMRNICASS